MFTYEVKEPKFIRVKDRFINLNLIESITGDCVIHYLSGRTEQLTKEERNSLMNLLFSKDKDE